MKGEVLYSSHQARKLIHKYEDLRFTIGGHVFLIARFIGGGEKDVFASCVSLDCQTPWPIFLPLKSVEQIAEQTALHGMQELLPPYLED